MSVLVDPVEKSIVKHRLFRRGQRILIGVSGGIDSQVLLHLLVSLAPRWRFQLQIAHFNHCLRGRASDADERFVRKIATQLKLPMATGRGDVRALAKKEGCSIEMAARQLRHDFFASHARAAGVSTVALAHHADDQIELFFIRLFRGAGADGLGGMRWKNPSPADGSVELVRPLLDLTRNELEAYAAENRIPSREDASNASNDFLRNRIRHELIPVLKKIQPQFAKGLARTMVIIGSEGALLRELAARWEKGKKQIPFDELPVSVQRRVLQSRLIAASSPSDFETIEFLRQASGAAIMVSPGRCLARDAQGRVLEVSLASRAFKRATLAVPLDQPTGSVRFGSRKFRWKLLPAGPTRFAEGHEFFDADKVGGRIVLRHWREGDRFQPIGMRQGKKLQDCFTDLKIPRAERTKLVVAETAEGEIFWVERLRISERFKLDNRTRRRLKWSFA